ncbi:MAG: PIN domain nuclease [Candidatus Pacebacteria bacterium CG10_big_fil_rev_8_21_14_0_10_45_6]|nr:MAG: PIN domain nuclease [Candidatus Pacebacteria bacterium CG10_big_fil_rev_8_21_14_0_10_45_6]
MIRPIVVDSSVVVKWFNQTNEKFLDQADKLLEDAQFGSIKLFAPELLRYEVGNALLYKKLSISQTNEVLATLHQLPITFVAESETLAKQTYKIARSAEITYYDASFVALAKQERATLITDNPKHQMKVKSAKVIALENY